MELYALREECRAATEDLLRVIGFRPSTLVCLDLLEDFLPCFEGMHPGDRRARERLQQVREHLDGLRLDVQRTGRLGDHGTPGSNSFVGALERLLDMAHGGGSPPPSWPEVCSHIVAAVVTARVEHTWGTAHPVCWEELRRLTRSGEIWAEPQHEEELLTASSRYPGSIAIEHDTWGLVAALLECRSGGTPAPLTSGSRRRKGKRTRTRTDNGEADEDDEDAGG